jgi:hypothetical protein
MNRFFSLALGALTAGAMGLGATPVANASCASAFGLGNSSQCSSTLTTIAIAIGNSAQAHADGVLGAAVALGNGALAGAYGWFGSATALGDSSTATAANLGIAFAAGSHSKAGAGAGSSEFFNGAISIGSSDAEAYGGSGNLAVNLFGNGTTVLSLGTGNVAVNTGNQSQVWARGTLSNATNLGGYNSFVGTSTTSVASGAFAVLGSGNIVQVGNGPFAVAGSILQTGATVEKSGPGFNINGVIVSGAAAVGNTKPAAAQHTAVKGLGGSNRHS